MNELKLYSVSDRYIDYLRAHFRNVYSNKEGIRTHTRKYLGVVVCVGEYNYYIPLSSPKKSDYKMIDGKEVIRKSIVPIIRIVDKGIDEKEELKGTLRISNMIPVPESELELYALEQEGDKKYKALIQKELIFIRKHKDKIIKNALLVYKQKTKYQDNKISYIDSVLDFKALEEKYDDFIKENIK